MIFISVYGRITSNDPKSGIENNKSNGDTVNDFKKIVAKNITELRGSSGMTQAQLGEKLNYSDKSVSKWERAESLPDAYVLKQMAELFGVTVDDLLSEHRDGESLKKPEKKEHRYSRKVITWVVVAGILALTVLIFVIIWMSTGILPWIAFVYYIPVTLITVLVLNSIWGNKHANLYIISGITWGIITSVYLSFRQNNWWQLFIIGVPAQIIIILSFYIKNRPKNK